MSQQRAQITHRVATMKRDDNKETGTPIHIESRADDEATLKTARQCLECSNTQGQSGTQRLLSWVQIQEKRTSFTPQLVRERSWQSENQK